MAIDTQDKFLPGKMSGYSESALLRKLAEVKISAPSIQVEFRESIDHSTNITHDLYQGVALWIMHHKKHYRATVRTW